MRHQWISYPGSLPESLTVTLPTGPTEPMIAKNAFMIITLNSAHFGDQTGSRILKTEVKTGNCNFN